MNLTIPPEVLLSLVVGGVSAVVALTALLGWNKRARLDAARALECLRLEHGEVSPLQVEVADDAYAALVELPDEVGLVFVLGDEEVTRLLRGSLRAVRQVEQGLRLFFSDFGVAPVTVVLGSAERRDWWLRRLSEVLP